MSGYFVNMSFELNDESLLEDWKKLSAEISEDMAKVDGFISRDSGVDEDGRMYCLVKWQSKTQQEAFRKTLESRADFPEIMAQFGKIGNMESSIYKMIELF
jgi:hypothetical protein